MPHEHEWHLEFKNYILMGLCRGCPATLTLKEVEALLNSHSSLEKRIEILEELFETLPKMIT